MEQVFRFPQEPAQVLGLPQVGGSPLEHNSDKAVTEPHRNAHGVQWGWAQLAHRVELAKAK